MARTPHRQPGTATTTTTTTTTHADADLHRQRHLSQARLKQTWEGIFTRFSHDFDGIADEIDGVTGELLVDNGHLRSLADADMDAEDEDDFSTDDDDDDDDGGETACAACADKDELDDSPCRHRHHHHQQPAPPPALGPTSAELLSWPPSRVHSHLAALPAHLDSCDLSFQLQKHDIGGRALGALTPADMETKLRLRGPAAAGVVWAEIRRLQRILAPAPDDDEEQQQDDVWAPPPRDEDPFYSEAWRDEHPDGTPAAFARGKRRRDGGAAVAVAVTRKRVKVVRVGAPKAGARSAAVETQPARIVSFEVAIPVRAPAPTPMPPAAKTPGSASSKTPGTAPAPKKRPTETPRPRAASRTPDPAGKTPGLKSILKKPATRTPTPTASRSATATPSRPAARPVPPTAAAAAKSTTKTPSKPTTKTPPKPATKTPPKPTTKTPRTKTTRAKTPKTTPETPPTPGWTTCIDRTKLKGHSFLGFTGGDTDDADELARGTSRGGAAEAVQGEADIKSSVGDGAAAAAVAAPSTTADNPDTPPPQQAKDDAPSPNSTAATPTLKHECARGGTKKGFCFVCLDLEGSEDDLV